MAFKQRLQIKLVNEMGKETALISIIVPVYNVEKWLERCIQSLVDQSYQSLEIILIDDGSTDASSIICDEWSKKDRRIIVVHQEHRGVSAARNLGIDLAHGQFISFVDSDDWVDSRFIEILHQLMVDYQCDLAECGSRETLGEANPVSYEGTAKVHTKCEAMESHLKDTYYTCVIWNKMYKREIITARFPEGKLHEDLFWVYQIIDQCTTLVHAAIPLYYHFHRSDSITGSTYTLSRIADLLEGGFMRCQFVTKKYPELADMVRIKYYLQSQWFVQYIKLRKIDHWEACISEILARIHSLGIKWLYKSSASLKEKLWIYLFYFCPTFTCSFRNALKIGI